MFPATTPPQATRTYKSTLRFLPRPILLRLHAEARRTNDPEFMSAIDQMLQLTARLDQTYIERKADLENSNGPQSWATLGSDCEDDYSYSHSLTCGHTVLTSTSYPTVNIFKCPCGPNCTRYAILKSTGLSMETFSGISSHSFCCSVCVEETVRKRYDRIHAEYSLMGWVPSQDKETNVKVWTHRLVLRCVKSGMRVCQGFGRVFQLDGMEKYEELRQELFGNPMPLLENKAKTNMLVGRRERERACEIREPGRGRTRSESPYPDSEYGDMFDFKSTKGEKSGRKYRERSPLRQQDPDLKMDELAEWMGEAKLDLPKDDDLMDGLMSGFGGLGKGIVPERKATWMASADDDELL